MAPGDSAGFHGTGEIRQQIAQLLRRLDVDNTRPGGIASEQHQIRVLRFHQGELEIPVYYVDVTKNAVLTSPEVDTIRVTVSDKGYVIASYLFGDVLKPLPVSFKSYARDGRGVVPASDLQKLVAGRMAASTKILSVKPDLTFYYNKGEKKLVAVKWRGAVTPENLYYISDVVYQPDSVTIYASAERLDSIFYVYTEPLHYADVRDTLTVECHLQEQKGVKMVPDKVTVSFLTDILTEESIDNIP